MQDIYYYLHLDGLSISLIWLVFFAIVIYFKDKNSVNKYILLISFILLLIFYPIRNFFGNEKPNHFFERTSQYKLQGTATFYRYEDIKTGKRINASVNIVRTPPLCFFGLRGRGVFCYRNLYFKSINTNLDVKIIPTSPNITCNIEKDFGSCLTDNDFWYFSNLKIDGVDKINNYYPSTIFLK